MEADQGPASSVAILQSSLIDAGDYCFSMAYYMYGENVGGKNLDVKKSKKRKTRLYLGKYNFIFSAKLCKNFTVV